MNIYRELLIFLTIFLISSSIFSQVNVDVNLNVKHTVGSISNFERSKFITIHANQTENEWNGNNFTSDLRNDFLNGYDVYLGRDTGGITWNLNQMGQDPSRPGFVDPTEISTRGLVARNNFASKTEWHPYEERKSLVIAGQLNPFWTGTDQKPTGQGWYLANATATGEYMGRYLNEFHGGNGQEKPAYVEIINEPAYHSLGGKHDYTNSLQEIADFHNEVADAIRVQAPETKIGGYTTAFPDFEVGDFKRWENRWKLFMDVAGAKMDFWSIHLYDFPSIGGGKKELRSGSNIEATFDMMEHYSELSFNEVKPIVISEYGAQMHDYAEEQWSPYRDWLHIKASNSQLMSFLERPNVVASAINFIIVKAEWGYNSTTDVPYNHRLMRKANEPDSYTGEWVYTDMVKFYQLWENVNGTRIDSKSNDLDIQVDAYIDGDKGYVILNNLNFEATTIQLNLFGANNVGVAKIVKKHLTLSNNLPVLEEEVFTSNINEVTLGTESTIILEYTFESALQIDETSDEVKYFAETYYKPIVQNQEQVFDVNSVSKGTYGEAVLRIGIGREHGKSLKPVVKVNGKEIEVPSDWRGYDQAQRERFFGVLEIPVPLDALEVNNQISVSFSDDGGHISSIALQVFNFSENIREIDPSDLPSNNYKIRSKSATCVDSNNGEIAINATKTLNYSATITSEGFSETASFSNDLVVDNLAAGAYEIEISIPESPNYSANFSLQISEPEALSVASKLNESNKSVLLKLSGGDTYEININGIKTTTSLSEISLALNKGINKVSVSTGLDCQGVYEEIVTIESVIKIYPNIVEDHFVLSVPEELMNSKAIIYSSLGHVVQVADITSLQTVISIGNLSKGIYFVKLLNEAEIAAHSKFIVK